ncbi:MAG: (d)CMP kinase [Lachnospiraceae bacterium]|nr:(d)CMP kinase [Lachnospiraceae bacterium]
MKMKIAIDGPAGAGKSTIAKALAKKIGFIYVDTGAMYRAIGLFVMDNGLDMKNEEALRAALNQVTLDIGYADGVQQVYLNGENVTSRIRTEEAGSMASKVSAILVVREKLVELQQELGRRSDVVMDGRDIGTVVLPDAELKVYFTASSRVRAERRYRELLEKGVVDTTIDEVEADIIARDYRDMNREHSPLRQAEDAILLDSSEMGIDEVLQAMMNLVAEKNPEVLKIK